MSKPVDLDALRERMATEGDLLGRLRARAAEYKEHDLHVTGDLLGEAADELALARAVVEAADTHVHIEACSSHVGCNCEMRDLKPSVTAYRAHTEGGNEQG